MALLSLLLLCSAVYGGAQLSACRRCAASWRRRRQPAASHTTLLQASFCLPCCAQAPDVFKQRYGRAADMWSVGMLMYHLLSARFPFWWVLLSCLHRRSIWCLRATASRFVSLCCMRWWYILLVRWPPQHSRCNSIESGRVSCVF